jgi:hypothetical protein
MDLVLIITLGGLAILITILMRPEIFLRVLRGGGEKSERKVFRPKSEAEFQAGLNKGTPPDTKE